MENYNDKREAAQKRVNEIKSFYSHLSAYIIINVLIVILSSDLIEFIADRNKNMDPAFFELGF